MKSLHLKVWYKGMKDNAFSFDIPFTKKFDDLMYTILDQMEWDDDHQYAIYCSYAGTTENTKKKNSIVFTTYVMGDNEYDSKTSLNKVDWESIKNIYVNYDFGDDHWFECKIVKIIEESTGKIEITSPLKMKLRQYRHEE